MALLEHDVRVRAAAREMERCLRAMVADHSIAECWGQGPCWPHSILDRLDALARPDLNDADGGRRGD